METASNRQAESGLTGGANGRDFLTRTRNNAMSSKSYLESELARQWERGYRMFNSQHPPGSKYFSDEYKYRSKIFRPKTRTAIRKNEARCAVAFFGTNDVVNIGADDGSDPKQKASADFYKSMMNIRLTRTIPWFQTCVGSFQTAEVTGVCFAKVYWMYRAQTIVVEDLIEDPVTRLRFPQSREEVRIVEDKPVVEPIPPENVRIHKSCNWLNPMEDTPFIQYLIPMFAGDIMNMTTMTDPKTGQPSWLPVDAGALRNSSRYAYDATRQAREGNRRTDPKDDNSAMPDHEICWVIENIERIDGEDWHWYTLGEDRMLSEPVRLTEVYRHGRPFVMGKTNLEAFKVYPVGKPELADGLQQAQNDLQNLRFDNVRYAMQGRPIVKRGRNIDLQQVARHISGSPILVTSLDDINFDRPKDVTQSSYEEQNFLNADHDDIMGSFSQGSVNTNRRLNETVGGMSMMQSGAEQIGDYDLRTFSESFVEPVMVKLLKTLQTYETDTALMLKAADDAKLVMRYDVTELDDEILDAELNLSVNVGIGQTDPMKRLEKFGLASKMANELAMTFLGPAASTVVNIEEQTNEIFGLAGYKDAARFYNFGESDPMIDVMKAKLEEAMGALKEAETGNQAKIEVANIEARKVLTQEQMRAAAAAEAARMQAANDLMIEQMKATMGREIAAESERTKAMIARLQVDQANAGVSLEDRQAAARIEIERWEAEQQRQIDRVIAEMETRSRERIEQMKVDAQREMREAEIDAQKEIERMKLDAQRETHAIDVEMAAEQSGFERENAASKEGRESESSEGGGKAEAALAAAIAGMTAVIEKTSQPKRVLRDAAGKVTGIESA